jgi:hypothetical protein
MFNQYVNVELAAGVAVNVTTVFALNDAEQSPLAAPAVIVQSIPAGALTTVPVPSPPLPTEVVPSTVTDELLTHADKTRNDATSFMHAVSASNVPRRVAGRTRA